MSLWVLVSFGLIALGSIIVLVAWIVSIIEGFKVHVGWGLANILGGLCLGFIPQLIFSVIKLDERWPLLVLIFGGIIPVAIGTTVLGFEGFLQIR